VPRPSHQSRRARWPRWRSARPPPGPSQDSWTTLGRS
jgi:hypothetical protein